MNNDNQAEDQRLHNLFTDAATAFPPPDGLKDKIHAQMKAASGKSRRQMKWLVPLAAAAMVMVAAGLCWHFLLGGGTSVPERLPPGLLTPPAFALRGATTEEMVAEAKVIVVASPLDATPVPPNVKGDAPEVALRFLVTRLLKGERVDQVITVREEGGHVNELVGKEWILFLSPDFLDGKYKYVNLMNITGEAEVKASIAAEAKNGGATHDR